MTIRQARFSVGLASLLFSVTTTVASAQSATTTAPSEVTGPVVASPVADSSGASTLDEQDVIRRLLQSESIQQQAQSRAAVADARGQSASLWDNPRIAYQRSQLEGGETEDQLQLSQSFDFSGRRGLWSDAASRRADAARGLHADTQTRTQEVGADRFEHHQRHAHRRRGAHLPGGSSWPHAEEGSLRPSCRCWRPRLHGGRP